MNEQKTRQLFLLGTGLLFVLIIVGLVWAIVAGPSPVDPTARGREESGLRFSDDNDPTRGPGEAKVVVRMYSDLQCPACRTAEPGLEAAMQKYSDKVRFVWNDFPLVTIHPNALPAANAARCAEEQGKFWEYRQKLYEAQDTWAMDSAPTSKFVEIARAAGIDESSFTACVANKTYDGKIRNDMSEGVANRVDSTPTFFVNNVGYSGVMSESEWTTAIEKALSGS
jgi:protein-disulfide isomerase